MGVDRFGGAALLAQAGHVRQAKGAAALLVFGQRILRHQHIQPQAVLVHLRAQRQVEGVEQRLRLGIVRVFREIQRDAVAAPGRPGQAEAGVGSQPRGGVVARGGQQRHHIRFDALEKRHFAGSRRVQPLRPFILLDHPVDPGIVLVRHAHKIVLQPAAILDVERLVAAFEVAVAVDGQAVIHHPVQQAEIDRLWLGLWFPVGIEAVHHAGQIIQRAAAIAAGDLDLAHGGDFLLRHALDQRRQIGQINPPGVILAALLVRFLAKHFLVPQRLNAGKRFIQPGAQ